MVAPFLLSTLFLALFVSAQPTIIQKPLVRVPFVKRSSNAGLHNLVKQDHSRIQGLRANDERSTRQLNSQAKNGVVHYVATVGVGSPPTYYDLIVDTGSSITWVGANKSYVKTSTSSQTYNEVSVSYGSGSFSGNEFIDQVTLTSDLVIPQQSIGVASTCSGFNGVDGVLGLGPTKLTMGSLNPDREASVPTVTDNLFASGVADQHSLSVSFQPMTNSSGEQLTGELTWGGIDFTKFIGDITYASITSTSPANTHWGFDASFFYGSTSILSGGAGVLDTGTTLILIASDAFTKYQQATGGVPDNATGLLSITPGQYANLQSFYVKFSDVTLEVTPNAQIWPRSLNTQIGGSAAKMYLIFWDIGSDMAPGLDFILGQTFLERFYSVYDTANQRVGLAATPSTMANTN